MNKDIQNIFESYASTWNMTPKESFKRDKRFFSYVIENNKELHPLKSLPTKVIFELYKLKLRSFYETHHPGLITENTNLTDEEAFDILQESTKDVTKLEAYMGVKDVFADLTLDYLLERYHHLRVKPVVKEQYSGRVRQDVAELKRQIKQFLGANPKMAKDQRFAQLQQVVTGMDREGRGAPAAGAGETVTSTTDVTTTPPAPGAAPAPAPAPAPGAAPAPAPAPGVDVTTDVAAPGGGPVPPAVDTAIDVEEVPAKPGIMSRMAGGLKRGAGAVGRGLAKGAAAIAPTAGAIGGTLAGGALGGIPGAMAGGAVGKALGRGAQAGLRQKGGLGARLKAAGQAPVGKDLATGAAIGALGGLAGAGGGGGEDIDIDTEVDLPGEGGAGGDYSDTADAVSPEVAATTQQMTPAPEEVDVETDVQINPNTGEPLPKPRGRVHGGQRLMDLAKRGR